MIFYASNNEQYKSFGEKHEKEWNKALLSMVSINRYNKIHNSHDPQSLVNGKNLKISKVQEGYGM